MKVLYQKQLPITTHQTTTIESRVAGKTATAFVWLRLRMFTTCGKCNNATGRREITLA